MSHQKVIQNYYRQFLFLIVCPKPQLLENTVKTYLPFLFTDILSAH